MTRERETNIFLGIIVLVATLGLIVVGFQSASRFNQLNDANAAVEQLLIDNSALYVQHCQDEDLLDALLDSYRNVYDNLLDDLSYDYDYVSVCLLESELEDIHTNYKRLTATYTVHCTELVLANRLVYNLTGHVSGLESELSELRDDFTRTSNSDQRREDYLLGLIEVQRQEIADLVSYNRSFTTCAP